MPSIRMSTISAGFNHTLHVRSDWVPNFWIDNQPTYNIKTETNVDSEPRRHIIKPRRRQLAVSRVNSCIMDSIIPRSHNERKILPPKHLPRKEVSQVPLSFNSQKISSRRFWSVISVLYQVLIIPCFPT